MKASLNYNQSVIFNAIFNDDMTIKKDCPREIAFWGGFGSGKSWITILVAYYICHYYSNVQLVITRYSKVQLQDTCIAQFLEAFPPEQYDYRYHIQPPKFIFSNGSNIMFRSFDQPHKIFGGKYDVVIMSQAEELREEHFYGVLGRMRGTALPVRFIFTEGNPRQGWCKKRYHDDDPPEGCLYIRATTYSNKKNLPSDYIKNMEENFPPSYIQQFLEGNWDSTQNAVYDQLMSHHIIPRQQIHDHWYKCIGLDHGTRVDTSIVFMAKDEAGRIYIYDEWHKPQPTIDEIVTACNRYGPQPIIADFSMKVQDRDYGSWWNDLKSHGLNLIESVKQKSGNILLVNQLLFQNKLFFFDNIPYVIDQHKNYMYVDKLHANDDQFKVVKKNDHSCDAVQYAVRHLKNVEVKNPSAKWAMINNGPTLDDYVKGRA